MTPPHCPSTHSYLRRSPIPARAAQYEEALTLQKLAQQNRITQTLRVAGRRVRRVYTWVNDLNPQGQRLDFLMYEETINAKTTTFTFLTSFIVNRDNVVAIANGGRKRWTIDKQGFNEQKTGYELEHFRNCSSFEVTLAMYLLLQITHLFM